MLQVPALVLTRILIATLAALAPLTRASVRERQEPAASSPTVAPLTVTSRDGTRIAFERAGSGPLLILVSGALSTAADGAALAAQLAPRFTVIRFDRRGRGASSDTAPYAVEREVEDIAALIDANGGSARLFGSSSGAVLALEAAAHLRDRVARIALYEPPFVVDDSRPAVPADLAARIAELVRTGQRSAAVELFFVAGVGVPPEMVARMKAMPMWTSLAGLAHTLPHDFAVMGGTQSGQPLPVERWAGAKMPALVLCGGASDPWLHAGSAALADLLPGAELRVLAGLDHSAATTRPQALAPVLVEFLGGE
jgi:pimeloyl-ACP methyl ester carboxylesterase